MVSRVWCDGTWERSDARAQPSDLKVAIKSFKEKTGMDVEMIYLNSKMIPRLETSVPEGIEIIEHNGVASWEIWLEGNKPIIHQEPPPVPEVENLASGPPFRPPPDLPKSKSKPFQNSVNKTGRIDVSKLPQQGPGNAGKHNGGRPRKVAGYSRITDWRRRKENQGVLL
jgi:hypothetical protein